MEGCCEREFIIRQSYPYLATMNKECAARVPGTSMLPFQSEDRY